MRRLAVARFTVLFLALVAASVDSATKVMHGVAHARETHESVAHGLVAHRHGPAADPVERLRAVEASDADGDHGALHAAVAPRVLTDIPMVTSAIVPTPIADVGTDSHALPRASAQAAPPWVRARTTQPRAPPLG